MIHIKIPFELDGIKGDLYGMGPEPDSFAITWGGYYCGSLIRYSTGWVIDDRMREHFDFLLDIVILWFE